VKVFLSPGSNRLVRQSISSMENLLSAYSFLRVHRSYLVSLDKITGYNSLSIQMGDKLIPIGRLYKQKVMDALQIR
jgi:DNA-binding LytR/AlgR family response regulator